MFAAVREARSRAVRLGPGACHLERVFVRCRCAPDGRSATGSCAPCQRGRGAVAAVAARGWLVLVGPRVRAPGLRVPPATEPTRRQTPRTALGQALRRPGCCGVDALRLGSLIGNEARTAAWRAGVRATSMRTKTSLRADDSRCTGQRRSRADRRHSSSAGSETSPPGDIAAGPVRGHGFLATACTANPQVGLSSYRREADSGEHDRRSDPGAGGR